MIPLRLILAGGAAVAVLGLAGGVVLKVRHDEAAKWKARVEAAQAQTKVEQATTQALDHYTHDVTVIHDRSTQAVQRVQQAPGGDAALPPDLRAAWLSGVRHDDPAPPDDHGPGKP